MRTLALREQTQTVYCEGTVKPLTTLWVNTLRTTQGCMRALSHTYMCICRHTHTLMYPLTHTFDMQTHQLGEGLWLGEV